MKIVIEGCDGVGKTTVCKKLAEIYGCDVIHFTAADPRDETFYYHTLRKENAIFDRHCIGELAYSNVYERKLMTSAEEVKDIMRRMPDVHFFILYAPDDVIFKRIMSRDNDEDAKIIENIRYINSKYVTLAKELNIPMIDTHLLTPDDVVDIITSVITYKEATR